MYATGLPPSQPNGDNGTFSALRFAVYSHLMATAPTRLPKRPLWLALPIPAILLVAGLIVSGVWIAFAVAPLVGFALLFTRRNPNIAVGFGLLIG
jgi:hypothetical protein